MQNPSSETPASSLPMVTLRASALQVTYKTTVALRIPSLICSGGVIAIVGHNGAGKSTLIKSVLGLLPPTAGALDVTPSDAALGPLIPERDMAFCPETGAVFSDISVESYIKLWCRIKHQDPLYYRSRGGRYMELLNIAPLLPKLGRELSKGQRRRVQTAIGFLTTPKLFLFDEPFDGLDVQRTSELADLVLAHRSQMTFIISSHRMDVMERIADQVLVLKQGAVASVGQVDAVCSALAGTTFQISQIANMDLLTSLLRSELAQPVVGKIGSQLLITAPNLETSAVRSLLTKAGEANATISASPPRLVDAMNYHLAEMQRQKLN